jgi:hypothetical protein
MEGLEWAWGASGGLAKASVMEAWRGPLESRDANFGSVTKHGVAKSV